MTPGRLLGKRVALAVCGGIAAFKAVECLRLLTEAGAEVRVLMTPSATRFVTPLTFEALSGNPVISDWLQPSGGGEVHLSVAEWAQALLIVPATASMLARLALGLADDIVLGTALATRAPLVLAPAMNDTMLEHRETEEHLKQLEQRGCTVVAPVVGRLASGKVARGRLAAPERIVAVVDAVVSRRRNLQGIRVVVSAGGTREPIDPVRYLGNYSSGKMGRALAEVASARGAEVTLVTTVSEEMEGIDVVHVSTAEEMLAALKRVSGAADVLVMAAAVADFKPATVASAKIHRNAALKSVELQPTSDVLGGLGGRPGLFRVAFAAETEDLAQRAAEKLKSKGTDLLVANLIGKDGQGLGSDYNAALVLGPNGPVDDIPRLPKEEVAKRIWDAIVSGRASRG